MIDMPKSSAPDAIEPSTKYLIADFRGDARLAVERDHRVQRKRLQLDAQVERDEAVGRHEHHDPEQREESEHVVLALQDAAFPQVVVRIEKGEGHRTAGDDLEQRPDRVRHVGAGPGHRALVDAVVCRDPRSARQRDQRQQRT